MVRIIFYGFFLLRISALFAQGPLDGYMKGKGKLDLAPSLSFLNSKDFAGANQLRYPEGFRGTMLSVFAAYGITDRFDVVASIPYLFTKAQNGLQDGGFYLKYRPYYRTFKSGHRLGVIGGLGISLPLSNYEAVVAGALGQRAVVVPARLIAQYEWPIGAFLSVSGGYNARLDDYRAEDLQAVRRLRPNFSPESPRPYWTGLLRTGFGARQYYTDVWVEYQHTQGGSNYIPLVADLPQAYGVSYIQTGGTFYYSASGKNGVFVSGAYIPSGRNVARIVRLTVGMVWKVFDKN